MPSLQTGLIQGGESGAIFYALTGLPREAPYLTLTQHAFDTGMYLANRDWYLGLSDAQRAHLLDSLLPTDDARQQVRAYEARILGAPGDYGIKLVQPSAAEREQWRAATMDNRHKLAELIGGDSQRILSLLAEAKAAYEAR